MLFFAATFIFGMTLGVRLSQFHDLVQPADENAQQAHRFIRQA